MIWVCGQFGTFSVGDKLQVRVEAGQVSYRHNGVVVYTSTVTPTYPLRADSSLHSTGATIDEGKIAGTLTDLP